jgi:hypothetical protein
MQTSLPSLLWTWQPGKTRGQSFDEFGTPSPSFVAGTKISLVAACVGFAMTDIFIS